MNFHYLFILRHESHIADCGGNDADHSGCAAHNLGNAPCIVNTTGVPTGDAPESIYMVVAGKHYNNQCCFDVSDAETYSGYRFLHLLPCAPPPLLASYVYK